MKNLKIWSIAMMLIMAVTACDETKPEPAPGPGPGGGGDIAGIVNEWVINTYNGAEPEFVVYIDFNDDNTFTMYQQVYSLDFVCYEGSYSVDDDVLTGTYTDGKNWASAYKVGVSEDGKTLTMSSQEDVSMVSVYTSTTIPEEVKAEASATRAMEVVPFL